MFQGGFRQAPQKRTRPFALAQVQHHWELNIPTRSNLSTFEPPLDFGSSTFEPPLEEALVTASKKEPTEIGGFCSSGVL